MELRRPRCGLSRPGARCARSRSAAWSVPPAPSRPSGGCARTRRPGGRSRGLRGRSLLRRARARRTTASPAEACGELEPRRRRRPSRRARGATLVRHADLRVPLPQRPPARGVPRDERPQPYRCEVCGASPLERVLHPVAVHYKGSGFYSTDYGRGGRKGGKDGGSGTRDPRRARARRSRAHRSRAPRSRDPRVGLRRLGGELGWLLGRRLLLELFVLELSRAQPSARGWPTWQPGASSNTSYFKVYWSTPCLRARLPGRPTPGRRLSPAQLEDEEFEEESPPEEPPSSEPPVSDFEDPDFEEPDSDEPDSGADPDEDPRVTEPPSLPPLRPARP